MIVSGLTGAAQWRFVWRSATTSTEAPSVYSSPRLRFDEPLIERLFASDPDIPLPPDPHELEKTG